MYVSYSGAGTKVLSLRFSFFSFAVYSIIIALLKLRFEKLQIDYANGLGRLKPSLLLIPDKTSITSCVEGAGTLI